MTHTFLTYRQRIWFVIMMLMSLTAAAKAPIEQATKPVEVTDLAGRKLTFTEPAQRIILGESRYLFALSILDQQNPLDRIVGMLADLKSIDPGSYKQYQDKFPAIDNIPHVGHSSADSFSIEQVLSLNADLAIFGVDGHGPDAKNAQLISQLERAGVNVVFIDFRNDPLVNTVKSMRLLGQVLGREEQAEAFIEYYQAELARVMEPLAETGDKPRVFLHSRVGLQDLCCETMAKGMMAAFLDKVHGNNVAKDRIPGAAGILNLEYLLTEQPDIYIATAIGAARAENTDPKNQPPYIVLGAGVDEDDAQASFQRAVNHSHLQALTAIQNGRAFAIWHHFYNTPLNVAAVQAFAKWLYPETYKDLNPDETLKTLYSRFQSVPFNGTYWLALDKEGKSS